MLILRGALRSDPQVSGGQVKVTPCRLCLGHPTIMQAFVAIHRGRAFGDLARDSDFFADTVLFRSTSRIGYKYSSLIRYHRVAYRANIEARTRFKWSILKIAQLCPFIIDAEGPSNAKF
jgi:hypothetical protein